MSPSNTEPRIDLPVMPLSDAQEREGIIGHCSRLSPAPSDLLGSRIAKDVFALGYVDRIVEQVVPFMPTT